MVDLSIHLQWLREHDAYGTLDRYEPSAIRGLCFRAIDTIRRR
jgi:hypothetical protein